MEHAPLEELLPKSGHSIYKLVRLASTRAVELADGKPKLVEVPSAIKMTTVALEEIRKGKVVIQDVAEQFAPAEMPKESKPEEGEQAD